MGSAKAPFFNKVIAMMIAKALLTHATADKAVVIVAPCHLSEHLEDMPYIPAQVPH